MSQINRKNKKDFPKIVFDSGKDTITEEKLYRLLDECFNELSKLNEIFVVFEKD